MNSDNMIMDWDDAIESDGESFVILDDGDYNFEVVNFERGRFPGGTKLPPCNKAVITVRVTAEKGTAMIKFDLILYRTLEWRLAAFFRCIGIKKKDERLVMDWSKVVGSKGRARFKQRTYTDKNGESHTVNDIDRFYDYDEKNFAADDWTEIPADKDDDLPW